MVAELAPIVLRSDPLPLCPLPENVLARGVLALVLLCLAPMNNSPTHEKIREYSINCDYVVTKTHIIFPIVSITILVYCVPPCFDRTCFASWIQSFSRDGSHVIQQKH